MQFDTKGPEGGLEIYSTIENGKAFLECKVYLKKTVAEEMMEESGEFAEWEKDTFVDIRMWDREDRQIFQCKYPLGQEESAQGMILHPHLWQGIEDPYLYRVRVSLVEKNAYVADVIETFFAFRKFRKVDHRGWFLNDRLFSVRAVEYVIPGREPARSLRQGDVEGNGIRRDLELIKDMGANTVCPVGEPQKRFYELCDELGLVVWWRDADKEGGRDATDLPCFSELEKDLFTDRYYHCKACWSSEPFVYISTDSLTCQENGNVKVTVYSNRNKVALYVEGVLFEFKTEGPVFVFDEIPVRKLPLLLSAETGDGTTSVTVYGVHTFFTE